jgi:hypothetical protein
MPRDYWPCILSRMLPGERLIVADRRRAAAIVHNARRRGWCVWRERMRSGQYALECKGRIAR